ncbi:ankyrin repeat-containing domain protein [Flagelloscypha sp. PMI_526]|nr:ankyrin repeat-containing domain protein [Flagelloscypha sp. PMI_526]
MDDEIYHKIKTWLMPIDQTAKLDSCIRTRSSSTCGWLWDSPRVVGWMKTGGIFWCHAGMGAGKTIIVSHVVETLMKTPEECFVAYYYFEFTNPSSLSEEALFRSLVSQLSHVNKVSSRHLYERHRNGSLQPQLATLQDTLHELVAAAPLPVYIIIDALDELPLPGRRYLIGSLLTLSSLPADRLRIMTTSRDELDIHKCFLGKVSLDFALEREMVHRDIVVFVDQELSVEKWKSWPEKEVLNARNILIDKADGMFRMVACQMEVLNQTQSTEDLRKALSSLPATLKDTYLYILNAIPSHLRTRAHTLLSVLCVSFEPVSVVELSELLAVDLGDPTDPDNLPVHCEGLRFHEPSNIMGLGMALVRQTRSWSIEFLQLSHASVKEYLLQDTCSWCAIDEELAHETTARTCLALLVLTENPRDTAKVRKITYSAKYWWRHIHSNHSVQLLSQQEILFKTFPWPRFSAGRSSKYRDSAFKDIVFFDSPLIFATGANLEQQLSKMLESSSQWPIDALNNAMHVAAQTGSSTKVLIALIKKGGDVNVTTSDGTSLLQASAHFNHLHVVRVLVEHGADVNKVGGKFSWVGGNCGSVLQAAASSGALGVVKFLVENGADMNMRGGVYGSALQAATREKDLDVVKLLVESGADVNMRGGKFGSALRAAVSVGAPDIIKFLVESGADVNMVVEQCGSALQLDADQMALRFATLFVESGADVNMVVERHGSVLQAAAGWGSLDVVKVLVENGADVNLKGGEYGSALHATAWRRSLDVVTFLVESGADVNTIGGKYGSILQEAAWGGNLAVLRFLVENGVDVNPGREVYGSALEAAKRSPLRFVDRLTMQEVMTFLVEKGAVRLDGTTPLSDELEDEESSIEYISGRS